MIAVLPSMIHPKTAVLGRAGGGKILQKYFPVSTRAILEKDLRVALCRLGIYSFIKRFAKSIIKDLKRS